LFCVYSAKKDDRKLKIPIIPLSTISTPTNFSNLRKFIKYFWKTEDDKKNDEESGEDDEEGDENHE
jgi:hypothetical protein